MGIPPAPRGTPQIEVTFDIDANGILHVSARDLATGKEQRITITASSGLSQDEVARMVKEAEANAAEDARRREEIEVRNQTDSLVYSTERLLQEAGAGLTPADRQRVEQAVSDAREALAGSDLNRIRAARNNLEQASGSLADAMARNASTPDRPTPGRAEGDVVDAEVVEEGGSER